MGISLNKMRVAATVPSVNRGTAIGVLRRAPYTPGVVRQVAMPPATRSLSTLSHVDYEDAFLVETGPAKDRTGEQWARAILEDAPILTRSALLLGWSSLGLRLSSARSDRYVLGWKVLGSTPDFALLAAGSRLGLPAQLLFKRQRHTLLFCTFVQQENAIARAVWAGVEPVHRQVVPYVLEQASLRERRRR
ncbi:MAG: hypothetical protein ABSG95_13975 [Solirubrobacteraceae bacterium]